MHPIVLLETEGSGYWDPVIDFCRDVLIEQGLIGPEDMNLFKLLNDPEEAADVICRFYANYQSQRYVNGRLVMRLLQAPSPELLAQLNRAYVDIITEGEMEIIEPTPAEVRDEDSLDEARVAFWFDRRHFGRLRMLIDDLNAIVEEPISVHPPSPFDEEQADRSW